MDRREVVPEILSSASRHHFRWCSPVHVGLIENDVGAHVCWPGGQHLLLTVHEIGRIEGRQFKSVAVRDRVRRTRLYAVTAKNASVVVNVINLGVALGATDAVLRRVLSGFNINAVRRAGGRAEEAGYTLFQPVFIALQHVRAAEAGFDARATQGVLAVGIVLDGRRLKHLHEGGAHALGDGGDIFQNRHAYSVYRKTLYIVRWGRG